MSRVLMVKKFCSLFMLSSSWHSELTGIMCVAETVAAATVAETVATGATASGIAATATGAATATATAIAAVAIVVVVCVAVVAIVWILCKNKGVRSAMREWATSGTLK